MAFPEDPLGLRGELLIGSALTDITADLYTRDPITYKRGRAYRANAADPASCSATIKNRDGKYTPRNPLSPYYGLLGRNTPFRITIPGGEPYHAVNATGDRARTPDTAALDITGDLDIRIDARLDNWGQEAFLELAAKQEFTTDHRTWRLVQLGASGKAELVWFTDGTAASGTSAQTTVALPAGPGDRIALRVTLDVNNGAGGWTVTWYTADTITGPWTQLGAPVTGAGVTSVFNSNAPLDVGDVGGMILNVPQGAIYSMRLYNGIGGTLVADADFAAQTPGTTSFTDSTGLTWTIEGNAAISDRVIRFNGEIPEWPPKWSRSEADAWTPIEAAGILRRLNQGKKPLDSTLRRRIPSGNPVAYWPLEDGSAATQFSSPIAGVRPLRTSGMSLAAEASLAGSSPLPTLNGGALLSGSVPAPSGSPTQWHTEFVFFIPNNGPATTRTVLQWLGTGTVKRWRLMLTTNASNVFGYDADDNVVTSSLLDLSGLGVFNAWCRWQLFAVQNGGNVDWSLRFIPLGGQGTGLVTTSYAGTVGRISGLKGPDGGYSSDLDGLALGHLSVLTTANTTIYNSADHGFTGETAGARMQRLSVEEGVPLVVAGDAAATELVGPQRPSALLDLLRECAEADGGIFGEARDRRELVYRPRESLYNQPPKLVLSYANKQLAPPFEPVEDDQVRNKWEVNRDGGSSGYAMLEEGDLSVQDPPDGIGEYPDSATLNLYSDAQTEPIAGWLLHLTTWDEARYPQVTVRLHRHPELIRDVLALDVGDKIRIEGLPVRFASGSAVELLIDGWTETFRPRTWEITFNCSPAGPWTVGAVGIYEDFSDTDYAVTITDGGNLPWARSQLHYQSASWSLRSGAITNNQTSDAIVTVPDGATALSFWYWTSSEASGPGFEGDRLLVLADDEQVLRAQGTTPWTQATIDVTGKTAVTFRYVKDNSTASGEDAAHIDDLVFTMPAPMRVDANPGGSALAAGAAADATQLLVHTPARGSLTPRPWITSQGPTPIYPGEFPYDVGIGGEVMQVTANEPAVWDAFGRTVAGGWGQADSGQAWTVVGSAADYSVGSGYGAVNQPATGIAHLTLVPAPGPDVDLYVDVATSVLAAGASLYAGPVVRAVSNADFYMARIDFTTAAGIALTLRKRVANVESQLAAYTSPLAHVAGTFYRVRFQAQGSALRAKIWAATAAEPTLWHAEATDAALTAANSVGTRSFANTGSTPVNPQIRFDNLRLPTPQRMTVVRSRNGVVKAQSAGAEVRLAPPAIVAL